LNESREGFFPVGGSRSGKKGGKKEKRREKQCGRE